MTVVLIFCHWHPVEMFFCVSRSHLIRILILATSVVHSREIRSITSQIGTEEVNCLCIAMDTESRDEVAWETWLHPHRGCARHFTHRRTHSCLGACLFSISLNNQIYQGINLTVVNSDTVLVCHYVCFLVFNTQPLKKSQYSLLFRNLYWDQDLWLLIVQRWFCVNE